MPAGTAIQTRLKERPQVITEQMKLLIREKRLIQQCDSVLGITDHRSYFVCGIFFLQRALPYQSIVAIHNSRKAS